MPRRDTGFGGDAKALMTGRSMGNCEVMLPGCLLTATEFHHRRPRGMGGTRRASTNEVSSGLHLCRFCHDAVERNRAWAKDHGFLVSQWADPAEVPVWWRRARTVSGTRKLVLLNTDGTINHNPTPKENTA